MEATAALAPTNTSLLRPDQVEEMESEKAGLEARLRSTDPRVDKGVAAEALRRITKQLETQRPKPYESHEIDAAVRREAELREAISAGMLSQEEMRKCPSGAVDRHLHWERENKGRILEWQNIKRRLHAEDPFAYEAASIESFRPTQSTMNMDGALISGKTVFLPPPGVGPTVVFTEDELDVLRKRAPEIAFSIATLGNDQRAEIKAVIAGFMADEAAAAAAPQGKSK